MLGVFNRNDGLGAVANVVGAVALASVVNALHRRLRPERAGPDAARPAFTPPGWVIGAVWVALFALMGLARWSAVAAGSAGRSRSAWVLALIVLCVSYPFYTSGFDLLPSMIGNLVTLVAAVFVAWKLVPVSRRAAVLIVPVIAWISFACVLTATQLAIN
jgi:tryptophan-rich sensory protein